jgi:hypothetical protein
MIDADWRLVDTQTVLDAPEFFADIDIWRNGDAEMVFIHLNVRQWNKQALTKMMKAWREFREYVTCPLYAVAGDDYGEKWKGFVSLFGFKPLIDCVCANGQQRCIYINAKDNKNNVVHAAGTARD